MTWSDHEFLGRLQAALERFDMDEVDRCCDVLIEHFGSGSGLPDENLAKQVLPSLQRKRCFGQLQRVADSCLQNGLKAPRIRRQYAQALLDRGALSAGVVWLKALVADLEHTPGQAFELSEARGLLGRAYKQIWISVGRGASLSAAAALNAAVTAYMQVYRSDPKEYTWHGINTAALLQRAAVDGVAITDVDDPERRGREIAGEVLGRITELWENRRATLWDSGTAMEACIALRRHDEATQWLQRYVSEPQADAFELGSTLRQLEEVWRLDIEAAPGDRLLPVLRAELLQRKGGALSIPPKELRPGALGESTSQHLEKVFGSVGYHSYKFMLRSIARARAVARVEDGTGQGFGTGFLVRGADLHESFGDYVLVTNAHVVSDHPDVKGALHPEDAVVTFQLLREEGQADREYSIAELLWSSPPWKLDATVLRLKSHPAAVEPFPVHPRLPLPGGEQRVYVVGHPKGGDLSFSMQDNALLDHQAPFIHYRAPTEGGSSGSPVFNAQWKLIGLHHAGSHQMPRLNGQSGTYPANEGIWIQSVIGALADELGGGD